MLTAISKYTSRAVGLVLLIVALVFVGSGIHPDTFRFIVQPVPLSARLFAQGYSNTNPTAYFVGPGACTTLASANSTGTQQLSAAGSAPVIQAQTSGTGHNTHTFFCNITPPTWIVTTAAGPAIQDATFFYGVQTTGLDTQVATLASGTMNSQIVFGKITYPVAGTSETPSTATPVRADTGTLTITPVVGSFNVATTTAGSFYSAKFTPAAPIAWKTDLQQLILGVALLNTNTSATITNSPGVLVHVKSS